MDYFIYYLTMMRSRRYMEEKYGKDLSEQLPEKGSEAS
jgi:hypothetical protein